MLIMKPLIGLVWILHVVSFATGAHFTFKANPFSKDSNVRSLADPETVDLQVDLGYAIYKGIVNATSGLNTWKGIRYAAPPTGSLRWQPPMKPQSNRSSVINATSFGPQCPQSYPAGLGSGSYGDEDCLFLNVYAPANASDLLPVFVVIHGGGYGLGDGREDLCEMIGVDHGGFVAVIIQYRLGAFGFLSSNEVHTSGVVNAGLLDQEFALAFVQTYINLFGGDASRVTIGGFSAGGSSVLFHQLAYGARNSNQLFVNGIAESPYLPSVHWMFWGKSKFTRGEHYIPVPGCSRLATWAFGPVVDGSFIENPPIQQLHRQQVQGQRLLTGHSAEEGFGFVPQNISTEADLLSYLSLHFPFLSTDDLQNILTSYYPSPSTPTNLTAPLFATPGNDTLPDTPTAINQSAVGTGQQQRAYVIFAEYTLICPSYWMAQAFSSSSSSTSSNLTSYKFQNSVLLAEHTSDEPATFSSHPPENDGPDLALAWKYIWHNFITTGNPSIPNEIANGASSPNPSAPNPASEWPAYGGEGEQGQGWMMLNVNQTAGTAESVAGGNVNMTQFVEPGLRNALSLGNATSWEGGRGQRCDMWRMVREEHGV
ncbi:MAG: hypothetical protein Q9227_003681 [Pyrenula ochraceoflavens]